MSLIGIGLFGIELNAMLMFEGQIKSLQLKYELE